MAVFWRWGCGQCTLCITPHWAGLSARDGAYAEFLLVPHEQNFVGSDATLDLAVRTTRALGKVTQIGLAGGSARLKPLDKQR